MCEVYPLELNINIISESGVPPEEIHVGDTFHYNISIQNHANITLNRTFRVELFDPDEKLFHNRTYQLTLPSNETAQLFPSVNSRLVGIDIDWEARNEAWFLSFPGVYTLKIISDKDIVFFTRLPTGPIWKAEEYVFYWDVMTGWQYVANKDAMETQRKLAELTIVLIIFAILSSLLQLRDFIKQHHEQLLSINAIVLWVVIGKILIEASINNILIGVILLLAGIPLLIPSYYLLSNKKPVKSDIAIRRRLTPIMPRIYPIFTGVLFILNMLIAALSLFFLYTNPFSAFVFALFSTFFVITWVFGPTLTAPICKICGFSAKSETGLKIHHTRKHKAKKAEATN